ncbi:hypothetical protein VaNZ11_012973 [Volvox africanus]|uniref:Uncharacterized protein n=1 Tax=Volvox africanus TaxID=51714 RepID=A0ABQ5SGE0_9CHLO|nr:hypothetical protein VaNZ11_012973 [Volvox africanus]
MQVANGVMDVVPGGMAPGNFAGSADQIQLHARMAGSRNRTLSNGFPYVMRIPSTSSGEVRLGFGADVTTGIAPTGPGIMPAPAELLSSRPTFTDCLSSIGLPGEESATFIPLIIEPYEPAVSTVPATSEEPDVPVLTTITGTASVESPPSPLTPPTAPPQPSNSPNISPMSTPAGKAASSTAMSASPIIAPRPPPGSAVQRVNSCRRNVMRQISNASSSVAATVVAAAAGGGGGSSNPALPSAPKTPPPAAAADFPSLMLPPPSPVNCTGEVLVMGIDSAAVSSVMAMAVPGCSGGGGGGNFTDGNKATSSFLDPSKPAVRRLLPPLLRASQAFHDSATIMDALPVAADDCGGSAAGCNPAPLTSRCSSSLIVGGSNTASPAGGASALTVGALEVWAELQDATAATMTAAESVPLSPPPPLPVDVYDLPSPRGRRALPPMDPLRTSALSATAEAISELDSSPADLTPATQPELYNMASPPRPLDVSYALQSGAVSGGGGRRSGTQRLPWESEGPRTWGVTASEAGEIAPAGGGGGGGSASVGGGCGGGGPLPLDMPRLRTWSAITTEVPLTALTGGGGFSGCGSGTNCGGAIAGGGPSPKERRQLNRANSTGLATTRMPVVAAAVAAPNAPLPPIVDRGGIDRRQTTTS